MKMIVSVFWALVVAGAVGVAGAEPAAGVAAAGLPIKDCWVFTMANLASPPSFQKSVALVQRAHRAGYTGIFLADSKVEKFQLQDKSYARNWRKFRQACTDEGMQLIVPVCPMGYAAEFLAGDPNLAEGMPVRDAEFVVRRTANCCLATRHRNWSTARWREWKGDVPAGWTVDKPGSVSFRDDQVTLQRQAHAPPGARPEQVATGAAQPADRGQALALLPPLGDGQDRGLHVARLPRHGLSAGAGSGPGAELAAAAHPGNHGLDPLGRHLLQPGQQRGDDLLRHVGPQGRARSGGATCGSSRPGW